MLYTAIDEVMPAYVAKYDADMAEYELALKKAEQVSVFILCMRYNYLDHISNCLCIILELSNPTNYGRTICVYG